MRRRRDGARGSPGGWAKQRRILVLTKLCAAYSMPVRAHSHHRASSRAPVATSSYRSPVWRRRYRLGVVSPGLLDAVRASQG
jgi:hypothetical protein